MNLLKKLFNPPNHKFYSDWTPLERAWWGLWQRPKGDIQTALKLNQELLNKIYQRDTNP